MKSSILQAVCTLLLFAAAFMTVMRVERPLWNSAERDFEPAEEARLEASHALAALQWYNNQRAYPTGTIPLDWREKAMSKVRRFETAGVSSQASTLSWNSVGPNNLGGRVRSIVINPLNPSTVYCGSVSGGVWKTTNAGASWAPTGDAANSLVIGSMAMNPVDTNVIYAGTGEGFLNIDALRGVGVLKSTNAGASWFLLNNFAGLSSTGPFYVNKLVIQPDTPSVLYAGLVGGVYKTTDAGASWSKMPITSFSSACSDLVMDPSNSQVVYASFGLRVSDGIYKTTNGGKTWTKLAGGFPSTTQKFHRISLGISPSNPQILYASVADSNDGTHSIQKTTDGGTTWVTAALAQPYDSLLHQTHLGNQGWYDNVIAVKPDNPSVVYAGGNDMFISTNGGTNWRMLTFGYSGGSVPFMHVDQHAIVFDPTNPSVIWFGNDGGVYKTLNGGASVTDINNNLAITQFYSGAVHPTLDIYYGGSQDIGIMKSGALPAWSVPFTGDGGTTIVDFSTPSNVYSEYVFLDILKSPSSGASGTWSKAMSGIPQTSPSISAGASDRCDFIAPFTMDPSNSLKLLAGTFKVYVTTNGGTSWSPASGDLTGDGPGSQGESGGVISALAIAKSSSSTWYAGTGFVFSGYGSGTPAIGYAPTSVWVTTNNGGAWDSVSKPPLPNRYVRAIAVDPANRDRAFVCYSGYGTGHVFRTSNRGVSWTDVSANLPDIPVNAMVIDPTNTAHLVIGTDIGVFESVDDGASWIAQNSGLANVAVVDLDLRPDQYLFATTHGRGMYKSTSQLVSPLSPHLTISVHQNAVLNRYIDVYLFSDTATSAAPPSFRILVGSAVNDSIPMTKQDGAGQVYKGSYQFTAVGTAILSASIDNALGNNMYTQRGFTVALLKQGSGQTVQSTDHFLAVNMDGRAVRADMYMTIVSSPRSSADTGVISSTYDVGPAITLASPAAMTFQFDPAAVAPGREGDLTLLRRDGEGWVDVGGRVDLANHRVSAAVSSLGSFAVGYASSASGADRPRVFALRQNFPNPFNPSTTISYVLPRDASVSVDVFDVRGAKVRTLVEGSQQAGDHAAQWDGLTDGRVSVASGVYFCRIAVREGTDLRYTATRKMLLLR